jgi:hypothetical protein
MCWKCFCAGCGRGKRDGGTQICCSYVDSLAEIENEYVKLHEKTFSDWVNDCILLTMDKAKLNAIAHVEKELKGSDKIEDANAVVSNIVGGVDKSTEDGTVIEEEGKGSTDTVSGALVSSQQRSSTSKMQLEVENGDGDDDYNDAVNEETTEDAAVDFGSKQQKSGAFGDEPGERASELEQKKRNFDSFGICEESCKKKGK